MTEETSTTETSSEEVVPPPAADKPGSLMLRLIVVVLLLAGAFWLFGVVQRSGADRQAVVLAEHHLQGGYIENALAELDGVSSLDRPGCQRTMETARRFIQTAMAMPELSSQQEDGLKPPEARMMPPAPGSSIYLAPYRPPTPAEATKIRVDYEHVITQVRQAKSVEDVALQLNLPRTYVEALLHAQAP